MKNIIIKSGRQRGIINNRNGGIIMRTGEWKTEKNEVISMEEYLAKRKKIREKETRYMLEGSEMTPLEYYFASSSSWS